MNPLLSIIIPTYNHTRHLPALLENIAGQTFQDFEIILVDDCSDEPCDAVVEAWAHAGLDLRLFRNPCRQYTKNSRLNGVEQARGELITFVDADDRLTGTTALDFHVNMLREKKTDILQFQIASYKTTKKVDPKLFEWTRPLGEYLTGRAIFETYVREDLRDHLVYGKIVTRALWQRCLEPARASSVRRYQEDLLLCSLLFFHAQSYVGSDRIGYARVRREGVEQEKAIGRMSSLYAMLTELLPYIKEQGASAESVQAMETWLLRHLHYNAANATRRALAVYGCPLSDGLIEEIEQHGSVATFVKALLAGFPLESMHELEVENQVLKQIIAAKEIKKKSLH